MSDWLDELSAEKRRRQAEAGESEEARVPHKRQLAHSTIAERLESMVAKVNELSHHDLRYQVQRTGAGVQRVRVGSSMAVLGWRYLDVLASESGVEIKFWMFHNPAQQHSDEGWESWHEMVREFSCSAVIQPSEIADSDLEDWLRYLAEQGRRPRTIPDEASAERAAKTSDCFVATAVYGSPHLVQVRKLRTFRHSVLQAHPVGRLLIKGYYTIGPRLALWVAPRGWARTLIRRLLDLAVFGLRARRPR